MTSILRNITALTVICVVSALAWAQPAHATIILTAAQNTFAPPPAPAAGMGGQAPAPAMRYENPKGYSGERISLDFQNADLHNIIRIIGEVSGKNIVVSGAVTGKVTLKLNDVPWDQALDIVLSSRNLGVEESGNVLTIYDLPTLTGIQEGRQRLAMGQANAMSMAPLVKKIFTPKYAAISLVTGELTKLKSTRGSIVSIGNDIYVEEAPDTMATMAQVFMRIDQVSKQILIEARIIEASSSFTRSLGVNWGGATNSGGSVTGTYPGTSTFPEPGGIAPGNAGGQVDITGGAATLGFAFLNKAGTLALAAQLSASEAVTDTRVISSPRIMAGNDQEVTITQGTQIPFQSSDGDSGTVTEFVEAVLELTVTPHIEENGQLITLDINLTNDSPGPVMNGQTSINTSEAETVLMVKNGETVVIGGIISDNQGGSSGRVPVLHSIPLLGWLFKTRSVTNQKSELLIFITANIIAMNIN